MVDNLDFFREFLSRDEIDYYLRLVKAEEQGEDITELVIIPLFSQKSLKSSLTINYKNLFISIRNLISYYISCYLFQAERNVELEDEHALLRYCLKVERDCLKLLRKSLLYIESEECLENETKEDANFKDDISRFFLLNCSLSQVISRCLRYMDNRRLEFQCCNKGIGFQNSNDYNLWDDTERLEKIEEYCKKLKKN